MTTVLGVVFLGLVVLWTTQRWLIYFPMGAPPPPSSVGLPDAERVDFTTEDGLQLSGWFLPARGPAPDYTILVFNGNGGNRAYRARLASALASRGFACLLFDYRGYGGNPGLPSEAGITRDARAARSYLASRPDVDVRRLVYFGESLGAAVAVRLATEHTPAALVLRSPFTSLVDIGAYHYPLLPVRWLLRDRYPVLDLIADLRVPLLVIMGDMDRIVPPEFSERVYAAAPAPKREVIIDDADHNDDVLLDGEEMLDAIDAFLGGR